MKKYLIFVFVFLTVFPLKVFAYQKGKLKITQRSLVYIGPTFEEEIIGTIEEGKEVEFTFALNDMKIQDLIWYEIDLVPPISGAVSGWITNESVEVLEQTKLSKKELKKKKEEMKERGIIIVEIAQAPLKKPQEKKIKEKLKPLIAEEPKKGKEEEFEYLVPETEEEERIDFVEKFYNNQPWSLGIKIGAVPFAFAGAQYETRTTDEGDLSPWNSLISFSQPAISTGVCFNIYLDYNLRSRLMLPFDLYALGEVTSVRTFTPLYGVMVGVGLRAEKIFRRFGLHTGATFDYYEASGKVGEVGAETEDSYLETPDGEIYYAGSVIKLKTSVWGGNVFGGLIAMLSERIKLSFDLGFTLFPDMKNWSYEVYDAEETSRSSEIPSSGFEESLPKLGVFGLFFRAGTSFYFGR